MNKEKKVEKCAEIISLILAPIICSLILASFYIILPLVDNIFFNIKNDIFSIFKESITILYVVTSLFFYYCYIDEKKLNKK
jgi:uncharacterized RDD family membrane protein YckC